MNSNLSSNKMKIHHIGIVVKNIQESLGELLNFIKFEEGHFIFLISNSGANQLEQRFLLTDREFLLKN